MKKFIKKILNNSLFAIIAYFKLLFYCNKKKTNIWLLGTANYNNIGDLAISDATKKFLIDNFKNYPLYEIRLSDYDKYKKALKKFIKSTDIIILQGGGNLGINYFYAENNRREIINEFYKNPIILFPSTIDYGNSEKGIIELKKSIDIYNKCKRLTLIAREENSYNIFNNNYNCNVLLTPDIVMYLSYEKKACKNKQIGICLRNDLENNNENIDFKFIEHNYECEHFDNICKKKNISIKERSSIVCDKLDEIANYNLIITDRLHTMIFCYITGTNCIAINNSNGKIKGVYEKWLSKCEYIHLFNKKEKIELLINSYLKNNNNNNKSIKYNFNEIKKLIKEEMKKNEKIY